MDDRDGGIDRHRGRHVLTARFDSLETRMGPRSGIERLVLCVVRTSIHTGDLRILYQRSVVGVERKKKNERDVA